ncbi:NHL repeat-containing protein [Viscerimonas tarda]
MKKEFRILVNVIILAIVSGFVWYIFSTLNRDETSYAEAEAEQETAVSPYSKVASFDVSGKISRFDLSEDKLYVATDDSVLVLSLSGQYLGGFATGKNDIRDISVTDDRIYLLFPTQIEVVTLNGQPINSWEACSDNSNYYSFTVASGFVFVTDAENKNICQYTTDGNFRKFISSPMDFIVPSFSFDIENFNDTVYCVNPGRQQIESYTLAGDFVASFGQPGSQPGAFVGCCNPAYIAFSPEGDIITSEKGNPRVSRYGKEGRFKELLLNRKQLGGGTAAYEIKIEGDTIYVAGNKTITKLAPPPPVGGI